MLSAFGKGFSTPWHGFVFMCKYPGLWRYGFAPILINLVITGVCLLLLISLLLLSSARIHLWFEESGYGLLMEMLAYLVVVVVLIGLVIAFWKLLEGLLCGYYYGKLAKMVELRIGTPFDDLVDLSFRDQVVDAFADTLKLVGINLGFLSLSCVPVIGSVVGIGGALLMDCWILGSNFFAFPRGLRGDKRYEIRDFCHGYRVQTLGLGAAVLLFSLVPLVGAILLTTAVTGTVLLHHELQDVSEATQVHELMT